MHLIYERYILKKFTIRFVILVLLIYIFYVLVDYSLHGNELFKNNFQIAAIGKYYGFELIKRVELLFPLCFCLSLLQTTLHLNHGLELVAFQATGISLQALLKPILKFGLLLSFFILSVHEFLIPKAHHYLEAIDHPNLLLKIKDTEKKVFSIPLSDGSTLLYQYFDKSSKTFHDSFWIISLSNLFHIENLKEEDGKMIGLGVDHFTRTGYNPFSLSESFDETHLFDMPTVVYQEEKKTTPYEQLSCSELLYHFISTSEKETLDYHQAMTHFWHKLVMPLFPLLLFFVLVPLCTSYTRFKRTAAIYTVGVCVFVGFYTLTNALMILGEHHMIPASIATIGPFVLLGIPSIYCYYKY